jgi:SAM-dependent methyltransferase
MAAHPRNGGRAAIWRRAGRRSEGMHSADEVVRRTGWVFNNVTGDGASLEAFVAQGAQEVDLWWDRLDLATAQDAERVVVEIGCGIGRMTSALTRRYRGVIAADVDPGFLERCLETVARHGDPARLTTVAVVDGRQLPIPDGAADLVFSYLTLQHCKPDVALELVDEAARVAVPGGTLALQFRTWVTADVLLWPAGLVARGLWRVMPQVAERSRLVTRLAWQASRLGPREVVSHLERGSVGRVTVVRSGRRRMRLRIPPDVRKAVVAELDPSHWFLIARDLRPLHVVT